MSGKADPAPPFLLGAGKGEAGPVVSVAGEVDLASAPSVREALVAAIDAGQGCVTVDLAKVTFMDRTGLSVLIMAHKRLDSAGRHLRLRSPSLEVTRVVNVSGLDRLFHVETDH